MKNKLLGLGAIIILFSIGYTFAFVKDTSYCSLFGTTTNYGREACQFLGGTWVSKTTYPREGSIIALVGILFCAGSYFSATTNKLQTKYVKHICQNCNSLLYDDSIYCNYCGKKLE